MMNSSGSGSGSLVTAHESAQEVEKSVLKWFRNAIKPIISGAKIAGSRRVRLDRHKIQVLEQNGVHITSYNRLNESSYFQRPSSPSPSSGSPFSPGFPSSTPTLTPTNKEAMGLLEQMMQQLAPVGGEDEMEMEVPRNYTALDANLQRLRQEHSRKRNGGGGGVNDSYWNMSLLTDDDNLSAALTQGTPITPVTTPSQQHKSTGASGFPIFMSSDISTLVEELDFSRNTSDR